MIIKLSLQSKEYLRDLEIFVRFRLHSSYPLREICDVTKTERKECHESYNHLVHLRNPETEEKWRLENLINHAWQQYVYGRKRTGISSDIFSLFNYEFH